MSIAYDAVVPSRQPTRWELPRTCAVAATIGAVGVASTFLLLYLARPVPDAAGGFAPSFFHFMKLPQLADAQVQALIYLQLSIGGQATIFVARTASYCFSETPGLPLLAAFIFAQVVSTLLTVFVTSGLSPMIGLGMDCERSGGDWAVGLANIEAVNECVSASLSNSSLVCADLCEVKPYVGWQYAGLVWAYCAAWILVQDAAKLLAMHAFDSASDSTKSDRRQAQLGNKQLLARASQASSAARGSRPPTHSGGVHQRSTQRSTNLSEAGAGLAGPAGASDMMLEPNAAISRSEMRNLPDLVAALHARVAELEAQLSSSGKERRSDPIRKSK